MKTPLPLLVTNGWDPPLRRLKATHPELEIITVTESVDLRSASEQTYAPELVAAGRMRFGASCGFCHGPEATGGSSGRGRARSGWPPWRPRRKSCM